MVASQSLPPVDVHDLDGNVLRFGSDPIEGQPTGAWRDMRGQEWVHADGGWRRAVAR